jgi:hypothetical protein
MSAAGYGDRKVSALPPQYMFSGLLPRLAKNVLSGVLGHAPESPVDGNNKNFFLYRYINHLLKSQLLKG